MIWKSGASYVVDMNWDKKGKNETSWEGLKAISSGTKSVEAQRSVVGVCSTLWTLQLELRKFGKLLLWTLHASFW